MTESPFDARPQLAVVGAAGFLGSAMMRAAAGAGVDAVGLTLERPLERDDTLDPAVEGVSTVVWCAARINPRLAVESPQLVQEDRRDLAGAIRLLSALPRPPRVVLLSSGGTIYGPPASAPFSELSDPHPVNAYGEAKLLLEEDLRASGIDGVSLRVSNAYGPGQRPAPGQGVVAHWLRAALAGESITVYGDMESTRDYVFVDDIARAAMAVHAADSPPAVVNVGSGEATTLGMLLDVVRHVVEPQTVHAEVFPSRDTDATHSVLDVSVARSLGWEPRTTLADGVRRQKEWLAAS